MTRARSASEAGSERLGITAEAHWKPGGGESIVGLIAEAVIAGARLEAGVPGPARERREAVTRRGRESA